MQLQKTMTLRSLRQQLQKVLKTIVTAASSSASQQKGGKGGKKVPQKPPQPLNYYQQQQPQHQGRVQYDAFVEFQGLAEIEFRGRVTGNTSIMSPEMLAQKQHDADVKAKRAAYRQARANLIWQNEAEFEAHLTATGLNLRASDNSPSQVISQMLTRGETAFLATWAQFYEAMERHYHQWQKAGPPPGDLPSTAEIDNIRHNLQLLCVEIGMTKEKLAAKAKRQDVAVVNAAVSQAAARARGQAPPPQQQQQQRGRQQQAAARGPVHSRLGVPGHPYLAAAQQPAQQRRPSVHDRLGNNLHSTYN